MVVISFLLVIIAAVTLIIGLFQDGIEFIWASIASCVLAMVFLGIGVLQRRSTPTSSATGEADEDEYSPSAISSLVGDDEDEDEAPEEEPASAPADEPEVAVVPKRRAAEAEPEAEAEEDEDVAVIPRVSAEQRETRTTGKAARERLGEIDGLGSAKVDALLDRFDSVEAIAAASTDELTSVKGIGGNTAQAIKGALLGGAAPETPAAKKATAKKTAKKATAKKSAKKATAKKSAKKATRGAAARERLTAISGVSEARADALLDRFGSLEAVRAADAEELTSVKGIGGSIAERIRSDL